MFKLGYEMKQTRYRGTNINDIFCIQIIHLTLRAVIKLVSQLFLFDIDSRTFPFIETSDCDELKTNRKVFTTWTF